MRTGRRKLLTGKIGLATLVLASTTAFPGCNLLPPPPCDDAGGRGCREAPVDASAETSRDTGTPGGDV